MKDYELISIENIPAGEYIVDNISIYNLAYDSVNDTTYRMYYVFNEKIGKPVSLVWKNKQGELIEQEWYIDMGVELYDAYGYLFEEGNDSIASGEASVVMHRDEENDFEYIKIDNFSNSQGKELKKYIKNSPCETIVIDLRDNYGGQKDYAYKYLFPALYDVDIDFKYSWKVPNTTQNEKMTHEIDTRLLYFDDKDKEFYYYSDVTQYRGNAKNEKKVYYLISRRTGSAADAYIAMIKENNLGIIVGNNTGGEGLGNSYICDTLKNSSLIYVYYPSELGKEDTYNQCLGIEPDVHINLSIEDYRRIPELNENENLSEYEKQLQYDTVLKWVIEDMKN
ncbi:MAG: S41 family peptidase [Lachnospiraceae bacterium]|nr:S41 family peptidase [Lachnospiraceae bacterium]